MASNLPKIIKISNLDENLIYVNSSLIRMSVCLSISPSALNGVTHKHTQNDNFKGCIK